MPDEYRFGYLLNQRFFTMTVSTARSPVFINMREVCGRHKLPPGNYAIIPSTYRPNEEARFMLRIFSEKACRTNELDDVTSIADATLPANSGSMEPSKVIQLKEAFNKIAGPSKDITSDELRDILNAAFGKDFPFEGFSKETARSMVALLDVSFSKQSWKRFEDRSQQRRTVESRCTAVIWLLYDVEVDAVHETSSLFSGENGLSFRPSYDGHHQIWVSFL
ncbi:unnamed protein product [Protopolystoma xenopodis]|uniref:Peptidase C2 calpain domain-containing protein n=1 Tax=Protopolystoma xenopodis TaxID=117903 RepID=A0A3S5BR87_9PLAT|nr:unnamed protein product [Protopolystoma xenopodis]